MAGSRPERECFRWTGSPATLEAVTVFPPAVCRVAPWSTLMTVPTSGLHLRIDAPAYVDRGADDVGDVFGICAEVHDARAKSERLPDYGIRHVNPAIALHLGEDFRI